MKLSSNSARFKFKQKTLLANAVTAALFTGVWAASPSVLGQDQVEEVVVTGSRIVRRDYESSSPIVTLDTESFENRSNIGLESALNQMPQFTVAGTQSEASEAGTPFPSATAAPGAATVNLRGLGSNRSLVLVDGKRMQPVNAQLVVDLNTIPSAAVESVEVISGGAAAVYGADAISGVVNIKLKKNFEGAEFDIQYGATQEGDGEELQFSGLIGADFSDDRGNVLLGFNYANREIIKGNDRDWIRAGWNDPGTNSGGIGTSNLTSYNPVSSNAPTLWTPDAAYAVDQNGNVFDPSDPLDPAHSYTGPVGGNSGFKINPDGTLAFIDMENNFLQIPLERHAMFASANFDLSESLELFADLRFSESVATSNGARVGFFNIWQIDVPYTQAYDDPDSPTFGMGPAGFAHHPVPAELADLLNSRPTQDAPWQYEGGIDYLPWYQTEVTSNVYQFSGGLRGDLEFSFADDWTWELFGSFGKSEIVAHSPDGFPHLPRSQVLFTEDQYGKGWINPQIIAVAGSCESGLPIFNEDGSVNDTPTVSQDCADWMTLRMNSVTTLEQNVFEANVQGSLLELPAGPLQFAAGASYREETFRFVPDSGYNANQEYANVVNNIAIPVGVEGSTDVSELYFEFLIPVVSDLPLIQSLTLEPGYRMSDYNTAGEVETSKLMVDWAVTDFLRFRGGIQKANRAPNVAELFTPAGASSIDFDAPDACINNPVLSPSWGNIDTNPNRLNLQTLCQHLMVRDGAPAGLYVPGEASADDYAFNVFGATTWFPFNLAVTSGNPDLESETAETTTLGFVLTSPFDAPALQGLRLSLDYYEIEIEDAIGVPSARTVYQQCMDPQFNGTVGSAPGTFTGEEMASANPFCALIQREYLGDGINDFGANRRFQAAYINQGLLISEGYDLQIDWVTDLADIGLDTIPGSFGMNLMYSKLDQYSVGPFPGADVIDYTGTLENQSFDYQTFATFNYFLNDFSVGLRWQHLPSLDQAPGGGANQEGVASYDRLDLFGRWAFGGRYEFRAGIDNLTDVDPEPVGADPTDNNLGSSYVAHDTIGRRFFVAAKVRF